MIESLAGLKRAVAWLNAVGAEHIKMHGVATVATIDRWSLVDIGAPHVNLYFGRTKHSAWGDNILPVARWVIDDLRAEQEREKSNGKQASEPPTEAADVDWHYLGNGWETSTIGLDTLAAAISVLQEIDKCLASLQKCCDYNECEVDLTSVTVDGVRWEVRRG